MRKVRVRHPAIGDFAFAVSAKGVVVGRRGGGADIDLGWDSRVSRRHGRFWTEEGQVLYEDLSSRNGSFQGTKRITEVRLLVGDTVMLGDTTFCVEEGREEESPELTAQISMLRDSALPHQVEVSAPKVELLEENTLGTGLRTHDLTVEPKLKPEGRAEVTRVPEIVKSGEPTRAPTREKKEPLKPEITKSAPEAKPKTPEPEPKPKAAEPEPKPKAAEPEAKASDKPAPASQSQKPKGEATAPRRFIGSTAVKLEVKEKKALARVWETELSKGRLFVPTETPPSPGTQIQLFVESPDGDLTLRAQVAQVLDSAKARAIGTRPGVGLHLTDLSSEKKEQILSYLEGRKNSLG